MLVLLKNQNNQNSLIFINKNELKFSNSISIDLTLSTIIHYDYVTNNKLILFDIRGVVTEILIDQGIIVGSYKLDQKNLYLNSKFNFNDRLLSYLDSKGDLLILDYMNNNIHANFTEILINTDPNFVF